MKKRIAAVVLACTLIGSLLGCQSSGNAKILSDSVKPGQVETAYMEEKDDSANDFALRLFQNSLREEGNTIVSPLSVLCALSMTANGARGETLAQMEQVLGMSVEELNACIYAYRNNLPEEEKCKVTLANSIWFTQHMRFTPDADFLQINADYYGAEIYEAPFDSSTVKDINRWIKQNTDGMIEKMIEHIPDSAVMYLINALTFDAEWSNIYEDYQIDDGMFTKEDGTTEYVEYMNSSESYYLEGEHATGVMKHYHGAKYAFAALLPEEGMTVKEYVRSLDAPELQTMLDQAQNTSVITKIPKFETTYELALTEILQQMGMTDAFDITKADFSGLGKSESGNIHIDEVLHKACITVDERGTKAGAVTVVVTADGCAPEGEMPKQVILDRPFVYMILDLEHEIPLFIGSYMGSEK